MTAAAVAGGPAEPMAAPAAGRLVSAVTRWAHHTPDAVAVTAPDGGLSFGELPHRSRALAGALCRAGAGPGTPVGLCTGRSRDTVTGLLAVWWLGANAVLLDDRHPTDRLTHVLADAGVELLVVDRLPAGVAAPAPGGAPPAPAPPPPAGTPTGGASPAGPRDPARVHPAEVAYTVYTSGTTGAPKGVQVPYQGLDTFLAALSQLDLRTGGTGINAVSPAFDGWLWCTLLYLLHGQAVAIVDLSLAGAAAASGDPAAAVAELAPRTVSLTPSLLAACRDELPTAEVVVAAGEPCPAGLAQRFGHGRRMLNVYGPTETTIAATWADSTRGDDVTTIGGPLPGYRAYVLDEQLRPVPDGTAGELCIAGPVLARGYRNQSGLTAARFVPDPVASDGARMYRTGDHVVRRPDQQLVYLGRRDDQVKVRGFRVELGEIERVAVQEPGVAAAVSVVLPGDRLGVAVVPASPAAAGEPTLAERVRGRCARGLPDFMVPATVALIGSVPVSGTGKVDRAAAVAMLDQADPAASPPPRPMTTRELQVSEAWGDLLERPVTDLNRSFFDLGGHSLLAARAVSQLRRRTGLAISVRQLLEHPTVAGFARELDRLAGAPQEPGG